jgi:hypothetical protein
MARRSNDQLPKHAPGEKRSSQSLPEENEEVYEHAFFTTKNACMTTILTQATAEIERIVMDKDTEQTP